MLSKRIKMSIRKEMTKETKSPNTIIEALFILGILTQISEFL